jgi:uncharacterized membrane protein
MIKVVILVLFAEIFAAIAQILFKKSTNTVETYSLRGLDAHLRFLTDVLSRPSIWFGLAAMAASLIIWLIALAQGELSFVFSIGSMQYLLILFLAHFILEERIDMMKVVGTFLVVFGIILITLS